MDYFRNFLGGQPTGGVIPSGTETVERLVDRVQSSTLLDDRRDAVRALKSLSKKYRLEVGTQSLDVLISVLENDRGDSEILGYALETLCSVIGSDVPLESSSSADDESTTGRSQDDLGSQFTEMFVKNSDNVQLLLSLLEEYDFHVKWPAVKLLTILIATKGRTLQETILASPMGLSKLMDLLSDSRDVIRNDGLLLLIQLTKGNANIQKIVAFENGFERLLDIIIEEGSSDGGIVVEDCLLLLLNLLKSNASNQNFFKEGSFIQRLAPFFDLESSDGDSALNGQSQQSSGWSAQKVTNVHLMLQLVRTLVKPGNPQQQITTCQRVMNTCGLLEKLSTILMASGVPADVLTETIYTVSEVIRGNQMNQEYFAAVMAPSSPPRPAIVVLLMSMVNEKQPFILRCAVLYCFQSFLHKNEIGQSQIVATLLPSTADVTAISAGQLLCGGLFSADSLSTWFSAVALLHAVVDNSTEREQLLRVQLATSLGNPPVSLLQQCTNILTQGAQLQARLGLLMLICNWLVNCPIAVTHFLHNPSNVPFLISQVSASEGDEHELVAQGMCALLLGICVLYNNDQVESNTKQSLRSVIEKRIGLESFTDKLSQISKHEMYTKAAKKPYINCKNSSEIVFDYEFTRLFKSLENDVLRAVSPIQENCVNGIEKITSLSQHDGIVEQYKGLIRDQDTQLNHLKTELAELQTKYAEVTQANQLMGQQNQQFRDQIALYKTQTTSSQDNNSNSESLLKDKQIDELNLELDKLRNSLLVYQSQNLSLSDGSSNNVSQNALIDQLTNQLGDSEHKIQMKVEEVKLYRTKYEESCKHVAQLREQLDNEKPEDVASSALIAERQALTHQISCLEYQLKEAENENNRLRAQSVTMTAASIRDDSYPLPTDEANNEMKNENIRLHNEIASLQSQTAQLTLDNSRLQSEVSRFQSENSRLSSETAHLSKTTEESVEELNAFKKDQEDLLVLLANQDSKLDTYRARLKELGVTIEDDEDDDFEADDDPE